MAFNIFATATSDIPLANLDANFTMIGSSAVASTLYPTATTSITYGTAGTSHIFSGSIGAFTLGGTVAGGGNQLNNVIIGTTTPLAGAFTTLSATKPTTIGDVITFTSGAASSKTGFLYVNTTSVVLSGAANGGSGMCNIALSATGLTLYGPDQTKTAVLDNTGLAVTGTLSATGNITTNTSVGGVLSLQNTSVEKVYISGGASYNAFSLNQTGIGTTSTNLLFATSNVINMTLDTSGNLGIGTSSPFTRLESAAARATTLNSIASFNTMAASVTDTTAFAVGVGGGINFRAQLTASTYSTYASIWSFRENAATNDYRGSLIFGTADNGDGYPEERARIDSSGNLLVGTTSQIGAEKFGVSSGTGASGKFKGGTDANVTLDLWNPAASGDNIFMAFRTDVAETTRGSIIYNRAGGLVAYNTTSDYRLKEQIIDLPNALETVSKLKPRQFDWKETGNTTTGFIAHELAEVCPHAVTGEKDATEIIKYEISPAVPATQDEEGKELTAAVEAVMGEREVPMYQGIDTSFLVATLTAAIQEQQAIITALTTRITALEAK